MAAGLKPAAFDCYATPTNSPKFVAAIARQVPPVFRGITLLAPHEMRGFEPRRSLGLSKIGEAEELRHIVRVIGPAGLEPAFPVPSGLVRPKRTALNQLSPRS